MLNVELSQDEAKLLIMFLRTRLAKVDENADQRGKEAITKIMNRIVDELKK